MTGPRIYNRVTEGFGAGRFAETRFAEGQLVTGDLQSVREPTDTERTFVAAQQGLAEQRARFVLASTTVVLDEQLTDLELRGDKIVSITAVGAERLVGNPEWSVTSMLTADGRNLVTGMHLDVNSAEARVINMLESIGDDGATPSWISSADDENRFSVNLDQIRNAARALGVADGEEPYSRQRKDVLTGIVAERELAASEYTLAAAAVVCEKVLADDPQVATVRFRYEDGVLRTVAAKDRDGVTQTYATDTRINKLLNQHLDHSDLCANPIDSNGDRAATWFNRPSLRFQTWEWRLNEVQAAAESYR